jgi:hypothetical protein
MSKAGSSLLRTALVRAANTARTQDPQKAHRRIDVLAVEADRQSASWASRSTRP